MRVPILFALAMCGCSAFTPRVSPPARSQLRLFYPGASRVHLIADWNQWGGYEGPTGRYDSETGVMTLNEDGYWVIPIPAGVPRGRYRYAFLVDGHRVIPDPMCAERSTWREKEVSVLLVR